MSDHEQFQHVIAERNYWCAEAQRLASVLQEIHDVARARFSTALPPEPPVGTVVGQWTRRDDGWYCSRDGCRNCPAPWDDVVESGGGA